MIDINVKVGITDQLEAALNRMSEALAGLRALPAEDKPPQPAGAEPAPAPEPEQQALQQPAAREPQKDTQCEIPGCCPSDPPTAEDVKRAIDAVRRRICGENYETDKTTPECRAYWRPLSVMLRKVAMDLAAGRGLKCDKPSLLPPELRRPFIANAESIVIKDNELTMAAPF